MIYYFGYLVGHIVKHYRDAKEQFFEGYAKAMESQLFPMNTVSPMTADEIKAGFEKLAEGMRQAAAKMKEVKR